MLNYLRKALYLLLFILVFFLYQAWEVEHPPTPSAQTTTTPVAEKSIASNYMPAAPAATQPAQPVTTSQPAPIASQPVSRGQHITVTTDVLAVTIDTRGGDIIDTQLLNYPSALHATTPVVLFNNDPATRYIAQSGLLSQQGPDTTEGQALYTTSQTTYHLEKAENQLVVSLYWTNKSGIKVTKTYTFHRNSYQIEVKYLIDNQSARAWSGNLYTQLMRTNTPPTAHSGLVSLATYFGAAISTPEKKFEKITFKQMKEMNLDKTVQGGWAAMIQHYFISAWVPPTVNATNTYYSRITSDGLYTIGMIGQPLTAPSGTQAATETKLYAGPAIADQLEKTAPGLKLTIDYGWFWFISGIIFWMMQKIFDVVGNWGWAIVLVTIIIKLMFYKLSAKSYRSMSALKKMQPRIEALKQRFGDDKQKMTQATLDLYRQEKVNPMSGCLPLLIQIPVFIALYWVLVESVELRQAPFILWIHDLTQQDPYYVLPVLMGISMFIQQRLNPPPPDPVQAKVMMLMPLIFTAMFANFPAGLMLYWFVNNTLSFLQQWHIMHRLDKEIRK
jgi:YidC/Oxa1 family membrane protein insertase